MSVLWSESPLAAADVIARVPKSAGWSANTVKTMLGRLVEKGAVAHDADGRRYLYRPLITRARYAQSQTAMLADKLFDGRAAPLVAHLADSRGLTAEDIHELEDLIAELSRDAK